MALKKCRECGEMISTSASKCPKCGAPSLADAVVWVGVAAVILGLLMFALLRYLFK